MGSRKCRQKIRFREFVLQENLSWKRLGLFFNKGFGNISKKGGLDKKGWRQKWRGGCDPQKNDGLLKRSA